MVGCWVEGSEPDWEGRDSRFTERRVRGFGVGPGEREVSGEDDR